MSGYRAGKRLWTTEDDERMRREYPDTPTADLARALGRSTCAVYNRAWNILGLTKSAAYLASPHACRLRRGDNVGAPYRFKPGQAPPNKGLRRPGWHRGRMRETQFKAGARAGAAARNWRPVGTILADTEGYRRIKVREATPGEAYGFGNVRVWPMLQRHVWRQAHGPIPKGYVVCFKDGDKTNCALENLEVVSRRDLMARNTVHNLPKPLVDTIQLLGALNRKIRSRDAREKQD